jgi:nitroreductase
VLFGADEADETAFVRPSDGQNAAIGVATIVATHYMLEAADLGLDTCWVGLIDTPKVNECFPETAGYALVGLFPTGHAQAGKGDASPRHTQRKELSEFVTTL